MLVASYMSNIKILVMHTFSKLATSLLVVCVGSSQASRFSSGPLFLNCISSYIFNQVSNYLAVCIT